MNTSHILYNACAIAFAMLLWSASSLAFPLKNEILPYGNNVVANGYARKAGESVVFYTESYLDMPMNNTIRASYWDGNRLAIAYKQLDFGADQNVPEKFEFIDYRRQRGYRITVNNDVANVKVLNVLEDGSETIRLDKDVTIDSNTVIDASFHRFVVANWDRLTSGKSVKIKFLQIDKARLVPLKIKQTSCDTPRTSCFKISFDNFLLQNVVPNIALKYETDSKKLIRYTGIGPITRTNGKAMGADIMYDYLQ